MYIALNNIDLQIGAGEFVNTTIWVFEKHMAILQL
jgi:hypothetical protein